MKHFSPSADRTFIYGSELLTIDAAAKIGRRASRRLNRRMPRTTPAARIELALRLTRFLRTVVHTIPSVTLNAKRW